MTKESWLSGRSQDKDAPLINNMSVASETSNLNDTYHSSYEGTLTEVPPRRIPSSTSMPSWMLHLPCLSRRATPHSKKTLDEYRHIIEYGGKGHWYLFQLYGSVWPRVFPWCIATGLFTYIVFVLKDHGVDLTIHNGSGHSFMSLLVSFLVVTRTSLVFKSFSDHRQGLQTLFSATREVVQFTCLLTLSNRNKEAQQWRRDVAYNTIIALRAAVAALEYRSSGIPSWEVLPTFEDEQTDLMLWSEDSEYDLENRTANHASILKDLSHGARSEATENYRTPCVWAFNLRKTILSPRIDPEILSARALQVNEELRILDMVSKFVASWEDMHKLATSPFAFPLAQMTLTFLFFWVFSLPLVLIKDDSSLWATFLVVFGITYGFFGLEYVCRELSDPYGSDPNDFPASYVLPQTHSPIVDESCLPDDTFVLSTGAGLKSYPKTSIFPSTRRTAILRLWLCATLLSKVLPERRRASGRDRMSVIDAHLCFGVCIVSERAPAFNGLLNTSPAC